MKTPDFNNPDYCRKLGRLFRPGNGVIPPVMAGREKEMDCMESFLQDLLHKAATPSDVIIHGPRGNGKTVLLETFVKQARNKDIDILEIRPDDVENVEKLARHLLYKDDNKMIALLKDVLRGSLRIEIPEAIAAEWKQMPDRDRNKARIEHLAPLLETRCRKKALLVTVDEAHTLKFDTGRRLLNLSERVRKTGTPFMLVLSGTPNLENHLGLMNVTFWSRAEILGLGRLTPEATRQALAEPLLSMGLPFNEKALGTVVKESQCYPFFIQVWGKTLAEALVQKRSAEITPNIVEAARDQVEARRNHYYGERYNEFRKQRLAPAAGIVADKFIHQETVHYDILSRALVDQLNIKADKADESLDVLHGLGYVWRQGGSQICEPGIPSLMDHVKQELKTARQTVWPARGQDQ
ncbi:MAG: ATP-binding protein [Gammaproteobacteria bacterium]|nr:ATP-binding protein [Gammaproteobacteria bacterium]